MATRRQFTVAFLVLATSLTGGSRVNAQELPDCNTPEPSDTQQFSGEVATVTEPFVLPQGVYVLSASHRGTGNFAVWIYDETGNRDLLFNEIGLYQGETTARIEAESRVILDIEADGPWEVSVDSAF